MSRPSALEDEARELVRDRPTFAREVARQLAQKSGVGSGLTTRQRDLFVFISQYSKTHGVAPSFEEMMDAIGATNKSHIYQLLTRMEDRGYISRKKACARAIKICVELP